MTRELPSGEVTFAFTDIEGSTALFHRLAEGYPAVLMRHREIVRAALDSHHGHEIDTEGDGFFLAFQVATDAIEAADQIHRALAAEAFAEPLKVRIGAHTGPATPVRGDYFALAVHQAARVASAANGGQTVISAATRRATGDTGLELSSLGHHKLKDFDEVAELFEVRHPGQNGVFPPLRTLSRFANNLPVERTTLIGRSHDLDRVVTLLRSDRLVTLIGPGGVGKTRMALEAASAVLPHHIDGAWLAELAPFTEGHDILGAVSTAMGAPPTAHASPDALADWLQDGSRLLVVDNCEHVMDDAAAVIDRLLNQVPTLKVLATSREPLRLAGERLVRITPLDLPTAPTAEAVSASGAGRLFLAGARRVDADIELDDETARVVTQIVSLLDGIPLALELASAQLLNTPLAALLSELKRSVAGLTGGLRSSPERHRGVEAVIGWSFELLSAQERSCLMAAAICAGPFDAELVAALMKLPQARVEPLLASLVDRSLLQLDVQDRYRALHIVREFCSARISAKRRTTLLDRHRDHFLSAVTVGEASSTERADVWRLWQADLRAVINTALDRGDPTSAATVLSLMAFAMFAAERHVEYADAAVRVLALDGVDSPRLRGSLAFRASSSLSQLGLLDEAQVLGEQALAIGREGKEPYVFGGGLFALCQVEMLRGRYDAARAWAELMLGPETEGDEWRDIDYATAMFDIALAEEADDEIIERGTDMLPRFVELGDEWSQSHVLLNTAIARQRRDGVVAAKPYIEKAWELVRPHDEWDSHRFRLLLADAYAHAHIGEIDLAFQRMSDALWLELNDQSVGLVLPAFATALIVAEAANAPARAELQALHDLVAARPSAAAVTAAIAELQNWFVQVERA